MSTSTTTGEPHILPFPQPERRGWLRRIRDVMRNQEQRQAVFSLADQAVVSATNFITSVVIGRLCSPSELGAYFLALTVFLFLRAVQENGICAPYTVYRHKQRDRLPSYAGSSLMQAGLLMTLSAVGLAIVGGISLLGWEAAALGGTVWALLAAIPLMLLREFIRRFSLAHLQAGVGLTLDVVISVSYLSTLGWLIATDQLTVPNVFFALAGSCLLAGVGWWMFSKPRMQFSSRAAIEDWRTNWPFAKWALASHFLGSSVGLILPWFVAGVNGAAETGLLAAGTAIVGLGNMFVNGVCNWLHPRAAQVFADHGTRGLGYLLQRTALMFAGVLGTFSLIAVLMGDQLLGLIYGIAYTDAGPVLGVLAMAMMTNALTMTFGNGLWALDRAKANFRADALALALTTGFSFWLIPTAGALGAAVAMAVGSAADAAYRAKILRDELRIAAAREKETNED